VRKQWSFAVSVQRWYPRKNPSSEVGAGGCFPPTLKTINFYAGDVLSPWFVIILYAILIP
jgi:hypothetical protein